jgi:hypothetical protein
MIVHLSFKRFLKGWWSPSKKATSIDSNRFTAFTSVWIIGTNNVYVNENAQQAPQRSNLTEHFALQPKLGFGKKLSIIKDIEVAYQICPLYIRGNIV